MSMNFETQWRKAVIFRTYQDFAIVIYTYLYNKYSHISSIPTHFQLVFDEGSGKNRLLLTREQFAPLYLMCPTGFLVSKSLEMPNLSK